MRFWTSDLHLGHLNIRDYCAGRVALGPDVSAMNEALIGRWNETVGPDDDVMIVGDICMGKIADSLALVLRLNGRKKLVPGNHDRCWSRAKKPDEWKKKYRDVGLEIWPEQVNVQVGAHAVLVCHFPYYGDSHDEDRYVEARPLDTGRILVCGHVHDAWLTDGRMINVGVDVHDYRPVPDTEIVRLIEAIV